MWECQWEQQKRNNPALRRFLRKNCPKYVSPFRGVRVIGTEAVVKKVEEGKLFGLVQCDLEVPEGLRERFAEMPPVFKNVEVGLDDVGSYMRSYAEEHGLLRRPRRTLIGSYSGKGILLATPLLRWYLSHGLEVTDVQQVVEYVPKACFRKFGDAVSAARRRGDRDSSQSILADTFKLLGNSAYGKTLTNIAHHRDVLYLDDPGTSSKINDPLFVKLTPLGDDLTEVELGKKTLRWNLPNQIGFFVYQNAKLRMLQFYYDCVARFVPKENFQLCEMDTDSLYMALSTESLEKAIDPEQRERFYQEWKDWFPSPACDAHQEAFVREKVRNQPWNDPPPCCRRRLDFDKRTPGLFKVEYKGDGIVALCSKTYYCFGKEKTKVSSKGLSRRLNDLTKDRYLKVLKSRVNGEGINRGFRTDGKTMYTYQQTRRSLSFFYIKRRVQEDGVSTLPLSL